MVLVAGGDLWPTHCSCLVGNGVGHWLLFEGDLTPKLTLKTSDLVQLSVTQSD